VNPAPNPSPPGKKPAGQPGTASRRALKIDLPALKVVSPQKEDLTALAAAIDTALPEARTAIRLGIWQCILAFHGAAKKWKRAARLADGFAKFGGGSLLTLTAGLLIAGQTGLAVLGTAGATLLLFVAGTMFSALFEGWSDRWELEEEHLKAVLQKTDR
jgi:hypothetical protein